GRKVARDAGDFCRDAVGHVSPWGKLPGTKEIGFYAIARRGYKAGGSFTSLLKHSSKLAVRKRSDEESAFALLTSLEMAISAGRLAAGRQNFVAPGNGGGFLEHGRDGAVFVFAELDGVLDRGVIELPAQTIENSQLDPHRGRLLGAFAGTDDFERFELLAFLLKDGYHVGRGAGAERHKHQLHRAGRLVGLAVGV